LDALSEPDLERVLALVRALSGQPQRPEGIPAKEFIAFFERFPPFTPEEVEDIKRIYAEIAG